MITDPNRGARRRRWAVAVLVLALLAGPAVPTRAHDMSALTQRELVRVQGYRAPAPSGVEVERQLTLVVLGESLHFAANEWRVFTLQDAKDKPTPAEPPQIILQGDRPLLRRIATAHADQRITILAERHAGGGDLFVLAVDLCPEK